MLLYSWMAREGERDVQRLPRSFREGGGDMIRNIPRGLATVAVKPSSATWGQTTESQPQIDINCCIAGHMLELMSTREHTRTENDCYAVVYMYSVYDTYTSRLYLV